MEKAGLLGSKTPTPHERAAESTVSEMFPWLLELGALLLSSFSVVAAVVILASQDDKPVTEWSFPISINAIIAVLGAVNKATLAFAISACIGQHKWNLFRANSGKMALFERLDEASRGPWGSLWLILQTR